MERSEHARAGGLLHLDIKGMTRFEEVTVRGDGVTVVFKQIAGLIARRIVFTKQPGDKVATGERIGLIKFGSRMDVIFGPEWEIVVKPGARVSAGSSVIARRKDRS